VSENARTAASAVTARLAAFAFGVLIVISPFAARFDLLARPARGVAPAYADILLPWAYVVMLVILGLWALSVALRPRPVGFGPAFIWIPTGGLLAVAAASAAVSIDPKLAAFNVAKLAVTIAIGWYVINEVERLEQVVVPVLVMVASQAVIAIVQALTQHAVGLTMLQELPLARGAAGVSIVATAEGDRWIRAYGLASHPNILGGVLAFGLLVIASAQAAQGLGRATLLVRLAVFGLGVAALFLTFSRAAWIAFGLGVVVAIAMLAIRRDRPAVRSWVLAAAIAAVIGIGLTVLFAPYLAARANVAGPVPTEQRSIDERLALSDLGLRIFADHPLLGTGLGTMPKAMKATEPNFEYAFQPAHVVLIDAAAETGILGVAFAFALIVAPWLALVRARRLWTPWLAGASATLAAVTVVGLFDFYTWTASAGRTWAWIVLGLWVVAYRAATDGHEAPDPDAPAPGAPSDG
jgi:O-antigen ligase